MLMEQFIEQTRKMKTTQPVQARELVTTMLGVLPRETLREILDRGEEKQQEEKS